MMDRREILKRFGIGAIIAPVIGGVIDRASAAELIEIPKVKPVELFSKIPEPIELRNVVSAQVTLQFADGKSRTITVTRAYSSGRIRPEDRIYAEINLLGDTSPMHTIAEVSGYAELM